MFVDVSLAVFLKRFLSLMFLKLLFVKKKLELGSCGLLVTRILAWVC